MLGEPHGVAGALDIGRHFQLRIGGEIIDRGEMEEMIDAALQLFDVGGGKPEIGAQQVALHRDRALGALAPEGVERGDPLRRQVAHEIKHTGVRTLEQGANQSLADKAAGAGDEKGRSHGPSPIISPADNLRRRIRLCRLEF